MLKLQDLQNFEVVRTNVTSLPNAKEPRPPRAASPADDELVERLCAVYGELMFVKRIYGERREYRNRRLPLKVINKALDQVIQELVGDIAHFLPEGREPLTNTRLEGRREVRRYGDGQQHRGGARREWSRPQNGQHRMAVREEARRLG
jgi:hypothetical protein